MILSAPSRGTTPPALTLGGERLRCVLSPEQGGRLTSFYSVQARREWFWSNPHLQPTPRAPGNSYIDDHDLGGMDDLLPTVQPCEPDVSPWAGRKLTDHGEVWCRPARVVEAGPLSATLLTIDDGLPFTLERSYRLDEDARQLRIDYRMTNLTDAALPLIWAAHPLLRAVPGMCLRLPRGCRAVCRQVLMDDRPVTADEPFAWPLAPRAGADPLDLERVPPAGSRMAIKLFADAGNAVDGGWVEAVSADGCEALRFAFDTRQNRYVGLWLNYGRWSGCGSDPYDNIGVEPTTSPHDTLTGAIEDRSAVWVPPGAKHNWSLLLSLRSPAHGE